MKVAVVSRLGDELAGPFSGGHDRAVSHDPFRVAAYFPPREILAVEEVDGGAFASSGR